MVKQDQYCTEELFRGEGDIKKKKNYCVGLVLIDLSVCRRSVYLGLTGVKWVPGIVAFRIKVTVI